MSLKLEDILFLTPTNPIYLHYATVSIKGLYTTFYHVNYSYICKKALIKGLKTLWLWKRRANINTICTVCTSGVHFISGSDGVRSEHLLSKHPCGFLCCSLEKEVQCPVQASCLCLKSILVECSNTVTSAPPALIQEVSQTQHEGQNVTCQSSVYFLKFSSMLPLQWELCSMWSSLGEICSVRTSRSEISHYIFT